MGLISAQYLKTVGLDYILRAGISASGVEGIFRTGKLIPRLRLQKQASAKHTADKAAGRPSLLLEREGSRLISRGTGFERT